MSLFVKTLHVPLHPPPPTSHTHLLTHCCLLLTNSSGIPAGLPRGVRYKGQPHWLNKAGEAYHSDSVLGQVSVRVCRKGLYMPLVGFVYIMCVVCFSLFAYLCMHACMHDLVCLMISAYGTHGDGARMSVVLSPFADV